MLISTVTGQCSGCSYCMMVCPTGAIGPYSPKTTDSAKCIGCGKCVKVCPQGGRAMIERGTE